jgi:hypothetical protein
MLEIAGERGSPSPQEKRPWFAMTAIVIIYETN